jgi:uncharacterized protein
MKMRGQPVSPGKAEGEAVVIDARFAWIGDIDALTGRYCAKGTQGELLAGKIMVFRGGRGSAYGPGVAYTIKKRNKAPKAMLCIEADPLTAVSAITAGIPMVHRFDINPLQNIKTGDWVEVDADSGVVNVVK